MKQNRLITLALAFFAILSILLTYYLLYDFSSFKAILFNDQEKANEEIVVRNDENKVSNFYKPTQIPISDTLDPLKLIYRSDETTDWIMDQVAYNRIIEQIKNSRIEITNEEIVEDAIGIQNLYATNHLQMIFANRAPLDLLSDFVDFKEDIDSSFAVDRIIILFGNQNQVYLIDSNADRYIKGRMITPLTQGQINMAMRGTTPITVQGYLGSGGIVYLPDQPISMRTRVYTLETLPENLFLSSFFSDSNFSISESEDTNPTISYFNYQYSLEFSNNRQWLNIRISRPQPGVIQNLSDKIRNAFDQLHNYEFWKDSLRYMSPKSNFAVFRRFVNGLPIFPQPGMLDFGATRAHLRNSPNADIFRLQIPLIIFQANIPDMSTDVELASADQLYAELENQGYEFQAFSDAFVAYEWQEDAGGNKQATLVPKWYLEFGDTYYSLDQIKTPDFKTIWDTAINAGGDN